MTVTKTNHDQEGFAMLSYRQIWTVVNSWPLEMWLTRQRNICLLVYGLVNSRSGCLSAIVRAWPLGSRRHAHRLKRLHRFLKNPDIQLGPLSEVLAQLTWAYRPGGYRTKYIAIALDWTKVRQYPGL